MVKKIQMPFLTIEIFYEFFSQFWDRIHVIKMQLKCGPILIKKS
jgi:hypothetical protein